MSNIIKPKAVDFENVPTTHITKTGKKTPDFYKGTSLRWCREWESGCSYVNDDYHIDLVYHKGKSWICTESHISNAENAPSEDVSVWELAVNQSGSGIHVGPEAPTPDEYGDLCDKMLWLDTSIQEDSLKVYSAVEVDLKLDKLNKNCTKQWTELSNTKANKATTLSGYGIIDSYTKSDIDSKNNELNSKIDGKLGKSETALNASKLNGQNPSYYATKQSVYSLQEIVNKKADSEDVDTKSEVDKKIQNAFNKFATDISTDGVVNTYKELIDYASEHSSEFVELVGELSKAQNDITDLKKNKIDKVEGKGLSTNDFTDAYKKKVDDFNGGCDFNKKDYYPDMSVGMADNLVGRGDVQDAYINFRPSAGADNITDGAARIKVIKGNSVIYNQLRFDNIEGNEYGLQVSQSGNRIEFNNAYADYAKVSVGDTAVLNHYYYIACDVIENDFDLATITHNAGAMAVNSLKLSDYGRNETIVQCKTLHATDNSWKFMIHDAELSDKYTIVDNLVIIDLTKEFCAGNEPTTVEEYHQRKPMNIEDEYAYNAGTLIDMRVNEIKSVGDNAFNSELGYARVLGGKEYSFDGINLDGGVFFSTTLNGEREEIDVIGYETWIPQQDGYVWIHSLAKEVCICLVHSYDKPFKSYKQDIKDLSFIGDAFPEGMRRTPLAFNDSGVAIPNTDVFDEIRFNPIKKVWEKVTRIGVAKGLKFLLGTVFYCKIPDIKPATAGVYYERRSGILSNKYTFTKNVAISTMDDKGIMRFSGDTNVYIKDSAYATAAEFNEANKDLVIYYELAEPIVEEIEGSENWNLDYLVWDFGTEEAIVPNNVPSAPFSANINYEPNAVDDLRWAVSEIRKLKAQIAQMSASVTNLTE